jgi:3-hydroxy-9,10-secoandrosta-1,3,5(10)-triene-9,17-dione monooxygenase
VNKMTAKVQDTAAGQAALRKDLVSRARTLVPLLRREAAAGEAQRRLTDKVVSAMDAAGLFALCAPASFGGHEADCRTYMEVVTELGRGDGSAGWIAFISNATVWVSVAAFPDAAIEEVFATGPAQRFIGQLGMTCTSTAKDGGIVINGRWGFGSNCLHAHWALESLILPDSAPGLVLVPMSELTVEDTWYVAGCRATGSNTVVATDVFVPSHRVMPLPAVLGGNAIGPARLSPVFRQAFAAAAIIFVAAPVLGMAEAAFDLTLERANTGQKRISYSSYPDLRKSSTMQVRLAEARSMIDLARMSMMTWSDRIADAAREGEEISFIDRARLRVDIGTAMQLCRDAVDRLLSVQGASAFADSNPMQRVWRDLELASRHGLLTPEIPIEILARSYFGEDTMAISPLV